PGDRRATAPRRPGHPARAQGSASGAGIGDDQELRPMTHSAATDLGVEFERGKPPLLRVDAAGDAAHWSAEHRDALRAVLAEEGSLMVRGLGLSDAAGCEAAFRELGTLMTEREAFAERRVYAQGVYSESKWPPTQPMCAHHELSYAVVSPGL